MQVNNDFVTILKNFATINNSIVFEPGNTLYTINAGKSVFAKGVLAEPTPIQCGIGDIAKLLNVISLFNKPYIDFGQNQLTITDSKDKGRTACYTYADISYITRPPSLNAQIKDIQMKFSLPSDILGKVMKALALFDQPDIIVESEDNFLVLKTGNVDSPVRDNFSTTLGETSRDFRLVIKKDNLPLMSADYSVEVTEKAAHFYTPTMSYLVAARPDFSYFKD